MRSVVACIGNGLLQRHAASLSPRGMQGHLVEVLPHTGDDPVIRWRIAGEQEGAHAPKRRLRCDRSGAGCQLVQPWRQGVPL